MRLGWTRCDGREETPFHACIQSESGAARSRSTRPGPSAVRPHLLPIRLDTYVPADPDSLIFTGSRGTVLRRSTFQRATSWTTTVAIAGLPGFHFHDLRHTGNDLAAASGASLRTLMARMGHGSTRAALIYQHTSQPEDVSIADALSRQIKRERVRNGHAGKKRKKK